MKLKRALTAALVISCLLIVILFVKAYIDGRFQSVETLQTYIDGFGICAPIVLIIFQALQVVIPVLPGMLGCAVGAVLFGTAGGFWCNYIGISAGSMIAFLLAQKYGSKLVKALFSKEKYDKYAKWAGKSKCYTFLFFMGMALPLFPDDFFCYFSGLTKMKFTKFAIIILVGKPWCILAYSLIFSKI